jgi:hypothetical protein
MELEKEFTVKKDLLVTASVLFYSELDSASGIFIRNVIKNEVLSLCLFTISLVIETERLVQHLVSIMFAIGII